MKIVTAVLLILLLAVVSAAADDSPKVLRGGPDPTTYGDHRKLQSQIINETYVPAQIINGTGAPVNRYPYTVSLQKGGSRHFCGGSLIAPDLVLTAAHCSVSLSDFARIVLNPHKLSDPIETSEVFSVEDYVIHPFYETLSLYDHDYMIIKLTGRSRIPTVRLSKNETLPVAGSSLQVLGWGTKVAGFEVAADTLQQVDVVTITNEECRKASDAYENGITPDSLCAAEVNKGACQGDSGGPLVIAGSSPEEDVQVGIVSWGVGCAEPEHPGVYARIEEEFDWIRFQVCRLSSNPPEYFGCDEGEEVTFSPAPTAAPSAPTFSPAPSREEIPVLIYLELDGYGDETGWKIQDENGFVVAEVFEQDYYGQDYSTVSKIVFLPRDFGFNFVLSDSLGDGFNGRVVLYLGEEASNNKILGYYDASLDGGSNSFTTSYSFAFQAGEDGIIRSASPSEAPSSPPFSPAPTSDDGNGIVFCFSGKNTVEVLGKGLVTMESINIGDSVRVGPGNEFARVYSFGHYDKNMHAEYVQIRTDVSASPLELTKDHMVFVQDGSVFKSVPASAVNVGDKLIVANGDDVTEVRKIERVTRRGAFAPFTKTGTIVVSGIVASNYISLMDEAPVSMQWMAHAFNAPHRMVCALSFEICENETYTNGISDWVYEPLRLGQWLAQQNAVVNFSAYMAFIVFFSIFSFIEQLTVSPLILSAVVTTCLVLKLTSKKAKTLL